MSQAHAQFIQVQHAYGHIDGHAEMFSAPGDTDLAAHVKPQRFLLQLGQSLMSRTRHRAGPYMGLSDYALAFRRYYRPLHNLHDTGRKLPAKIYGGTADSPPGQFFLNLLFFLPAGGYGQTYGRPAHHDTGNTARSIFYHSTHLIT